jgi:hypothetical protein
MLERFQLLAAACFVLAAVLQCNDPDPYVWIAIYGAAALVSWLQRSRPARLIPALLVGCIATIWAFSLFPEAQGVGLLELPRPMQTKGGAVEAAREVGGLSTVAVWMFVLAAFARREKRT